MISLLDEDFSQLNIFLEKQKPSKLFILVDENTHQYCLPMLLGNLETLIPFEIIEIESGEELKNIETATQLWQILAEFEADRKCLVINLGGGVITDLGGFVASTYKRGVKFINVPTSLLGMCDASIGGKTGVDLSFLKNMVGTFSLPERIFLYPKFLETLPFVELRSGFAEMLKHGLIADKNHWEDLISIKDLTFSHITPYIERSMQIKQEIIEKDFREENIRKTLNFGHTIGHAVESLFLKSGKAVPHGEAIAMGMICETKLSEIEGFINQNTCDEIIYSLIKYFPALNISDFSDEEIISLMKNDKKNVGNKLNFSLIKGVGAGISNLKCEEENIKKSIDYYRIF